MGRLLAFFKRVTPLRISLSIAVFFSMVHFVIENDTFQQGPLSQKGFLHQLDLKALDLKFHNRTIDQFPDPKVVIGAIDEKGVEEFGLWPWRRSVIADFITAATEGGAKVIGFDAVFSDEDRNASYQDIKGFLDAFAENDLSSGSSGVRALYAQLDDLEKSQSQTADVIGKLEKEPKKDQKKPGNAKDPIATALKKANQAFTKNKATIKKLRTALAAYYARADKFEGAMRHVVQAGSPDAALTKALKNSPITVMGVINFYSAEDIVGVSEKDLAKAAANLEKIAITEVFEETYKEIGGNLIESISPTDIDVTKLQIARVVAMRAPLPMFGEVTEGFGYFNVVPDPDGPMRRVRMLNLYENKLYPSLSLAAAARYLDADIRPLNGSIKPGVTIDGIRLGDRMVPTNLHGHLMVNYFTDPACQNWKSRTSDQDCEPFFPTYSVADFVNGTLPKEAYADKVVLFGMTAMGLFDLRPTPFASNTPGVYIHATAIQNILDNSFMERYFGIALLEIFAYLMLGLIMGIALPRVPPWAGFLLSAGFVVGLFWFDTAFVFSRGTWMLNVLPTFQIGSTFIGISLHSFLTEGREKRKIRKAFQFYLTKSVVDEMLKEPGKLKLGGEKRVCTVLFSDIRGFTTISERLTPEQLSNLLNEYLTPMTNLVFKYDGTLDKYMGDAIMAIFGAPVSYEDHAARSCFCALEMMEELRVLQVGWRERGVPELDIGIGMNTGDMAVGNMGSEIRFDYTVMGDNVNLGSRLEGINKQYGTNIIISQSTRKAAGDRVHVRELDAVRVKGKREPVIIYELLGKGQPDEGAQTLITTFAQGLAAFKGQKWDEAIATFDRVCKEIKPNDFASNMYIQRCEAMKLEPPGDDWDGVFTMKTK